MRIRMLMVCTMYVYNVWRDVLYCRFQDEINWKSFTHGLPPNRYSGYTVYYYVLSIGIATSKSTDWREYWLVANKFAAYLIQYTLLCHSFTSCIHSDGDKKWRWQIMTSQQHQSIFFWHKLVQVNSQSNKCQRVDDGLRVSQCVQHYTDTKLVLTQVKNGWHH